MNTRLLIGTHFIQNFVVLKRNIYFKNIKPSSVNIIFSIHFHSRECKMYIVSVGINYTKLH